MADVSIQFPIEIGGVEHEVRALVLYHPGHPGTLYQRNGDPGDPPEPSEVEVIAWKIRTIGGEWIQPTPDLARAVDEWTESQGGMEELERLAVEEIDGEDSRAAEAKADERREASYDVY